MLARDYRKTALNALYGNWVISIIVTLVAVLLGANIGAGSNAVSTLSSSNADSNSTFQRTIENINIPPFILVIILSLLSIAFIYFIIVLILGGVMKLGLVTYNIDLVTKRRAPEFATLFSHFHNFKKAFALNFLISLFTFLWSLLFVIPGVIAAYRYSMAPYLLAENPDMGVMDAIRRSKEIMQGNKKRLFFLELSFIGWHILCGISFGIGYLFLNPYIAAAQAAFYLDITGR